MKQRITKEQLKTLSVKQAQQLREWWKPKYGDMFCNGHWADIVDSFEKYEDEKGTGTIRTVSCDQDGCNGYENKSDCLPLLTIGEMFELIHDKTGVWAEPFRAGIEGPEEQWNIDNNIVHNYEVELCDLLWQFVEIVL